MVSKDSPIKFTPLQLELLKLFGRDVSDEEFLAIKDIIGRYFLRKLQAEVDSSVERNGYNTDDFESWLLD